MRLYGKFADLIDLRRIPSRRRGVIWYTAGGWIGNGILILQGFLLIPLYIHYLGTDLYGYWLASGGVLAWFSMVDVGSAAITRQRCAQAYGKQLFQRMVDYFWHGLVVMLAIIGIFLLLLFSLAPKIPEFIRADESYHLLIKNCLLLSGAGLALYLLEIYLKEFAASAQRNEITTLLGILGLLIGLILIILGLVVFGWGLYSLAIAALLRPIVPMIGNGIFAILLLRSTQCQVKWSRAVFKDYLLTSPAVLSAKATGIFSSHLPVILLTRWFGPEVTVAYNVSITLISALKHFFSHAFSSLHGATAHYFSDPAVTDERKQLLFRKLAKAFTIATVAGFGGYVLVNQGFVHLWISPDKYLGNFFTLLAATAILLQLRNTIYLTMISAHGAISLSGYGSAAERVFTALLQIILIKTYGAEGALMALIVGSLTAQIPYQKILTKLQPQAASGLSSLQWLWLPSTLLFLLISSISGWFVFESWYHFISGCAVLSPIFVFTILIARRQAVEVTGR